MPRLLVAAALAGSIAHVSAQSSVSITAIDRPSGETFALITINGNGFDPAGAISVVFSARDAITVTVPVVSATATAVRVATPALVSSRSGNLFDTPVVADVQVVQATSSSLMTSNTLGGFTIEPPPQASGPAGTFTRAFIRTVLDVQTDLRGARQSTAAFGPVVAASLAFAEAQRPLLDAAGAIVANSEATVNLPTTNGLPFLVSARTMRATDRLAVAFVRQANEAAAHASASGIPGAPSGADVRPADVPGGCQCNTTTEAEQWLCEFRRNPCVAHEAAKKVVPELAVGVYGAQFGFLAGWAAGGLASAGLIASETAAGLGFLAGQAISYGTAVLAGVDPPGAWSLIRDSGSTLLDDLSNNGLGILSGLNTGIGLGQTIETVVTSTRGPLPAGPRGGVIVAGPQPANPPANTRPSVVYAAGQTARWIATSATQQVTSLLSAVLPQPSVARFNGSYSGSSTVSCTVQTPEGPLTTGGSGPATATVLNGVLTSDGNVGAVSDTGRFTAPYVAAGGVGCTVGGRFWQDPSSGDAGASGFLSCSGAGVSCSGSWGLTRAR